MQYKVRLDNLPWFELQDRFCTFQKDQRSMFYLSISEESMTVTYLLDVLGDQLGRDLRAIDKQRLSPFIDYLFTSWVSGSHTFDTEESSHALYSYFRPFILDRQKGELLEGVSRILGPLSDGFLQFLIYTINLLSNNLLSESDIDRIVQWVEEIQGYSLLAKLLSLKIPTIKAFASNLLLGALKLKNTSLVLALLNAGTNPNSPIGNRRLRPLHYAAWSGSNEILQLLLKFGADINAVATGYSGRTALQAASEREHIELVRVLLNYGADINAPAAVDYGRIALQAASEQGHIELVQFLLNIGADDEVLGGLPSKQYTQGSRVDQLHCC
jgi:hypothetical protein